MFLPRGPLPALVFITGSSCFSFAVRLQGPWGWPLLRHCPQYVGESRRTLVEMAGGQAEAPGCAWGGSWVVSIPHGPGSGWGK